MPWVGGIAVVVLSALTLAGAGDPAFSGDLDDSFGDAGRVVIPIGQYGGTVTASALQSDGKIVLAGYTNSPQDFVAIRLNADGSRDTSFGVNGIVQTPIDLAPDGLDRANGVALGPNGTIVLAGRARDSAGDWQWAFVRYTSTGVLDTTFSGDGIQTLALGGWPGWYHGAASVQIQPDGKVVAAGSVTPAWTVVRLGADGNLDGTFDSNGVVQTQIRDLADRDAASAIQVLADGSLVVAGSADGDSDFALVRYLPDGDLDTTFGTNGLVVTPGIGPDAVADLELLADGRLLVAGHDSGTDPGHAWFRLARYMPGGALDSSFGDAGVVTTDIPHASYAVAYSVELQADGKLIVAGTAEPDDTFHSVFALARYHGDGLLDSSFGDAGTRTHDFACDDSAGYSAVIQAAESRERIVQVGTGSCYGEHAVTVIGVQTSGISPPQGDYRIESHTGRPLIPGTQRIENTCPDCTTTLSLPWPVWAYGVPYTRVNVSSNGNLQFNSNSPEPINNCLPFPHLSTTISPYWDDLRTSEGGGIWTGVVGSPGSRRFVIEWREVDLRRGGTATFEVILREDSPDISVVYGPSSGPDANGASAVAGVQRNGTVGRRFSCWEEVLVNGLQLDYIWEGDLLPPPPPPPPGPPPPPPPPPPGPPPPPPPPPGPPPAPPPPPPGPPPPPPPPAPPPGPPAPPPKPIQCRVPGVVGRTLVVARLRIRRAGCAVGRVRRMRSRRRAGIVLTQSPRVGARFSRRAVIHLVVSKGRR